MKATIFILNGKPVASVRCEPEQPSTKDYNKVAEYKQKYDEYLKTLKEWESECMEIENAVQFTHQESAKDWYFEETDIMTHLLREGTKAEIRKTALGCIVTKIIN